MKEFYFKNKCLYYRTNEFKSDKLTLVFIHGLSSSSSAWLSYEKIFENKYNILTFDIRGHGKSKKFPNYSDYEIKHFANDIHDLTSHLKISKFVLISHSFATLIALEYIKLYKENVLANILLSPIVNLNKNLSVKILRLVLSLSRIFPFQSNPGHHVDYTKHQNTNDWDIARCYADVSNTTLRVYLHCLKQSFKLKQEYGLGEITIPTLIVHGTKDTMSPTKNSIALSKKIQGSELVLIPSANHVIVLNNIKEVSQYIESFVKKNVNLV